MMARLAAMAFAGMMGAMPLAAGERGPIVVELFTSQGCSSCPPADALLGELSDRGDVLPLALHVDYWDYLGWKDVFASPAYSKRQKNYARAAGRRMVYTPQMIIGGAGAVVGTHPMDVADLIRVEREREVNLSLKIAAAGQGTFRVALRNGGDTGPYVVQLVHFEPHELVEIRTGENAGEKIGYSNIVTHWQVLSHWDGAAPLELTVSPAQDRPGAVLVQREGPGVIEAAARLP